MKILALANWIADLHPGLKAVLVVLTVALAFLIVVYLLGPRSAALDQVVDAKLPRSRDPRKWLKWIRGRGISFRRFVCSLIVIIVVILLALLIFPDVGPVAKLLGRNIPSSVPAHLFVQYNQNYSYLYLKESADKHASNVEDVLTFQNITTEPLTFFRISIFVFKDFANPKAFYHTYSLDSGTEYQSLGTIDVGSLGREQKYVLPMTEIYDRFRSKIDMNKETFDEFLFPTVGRTLTCVIDTPSTKQHQVFTDDEKILNIIAMLAPHPTGQQLDAICGVPLKLVVHYRLAGNQYSLLFMGGAFYFGRKTDGDLVPYPVVVASFVKPRLSLGRRQSGATPKVINMDLEVSGTYSGQIGDPEIMAFYFVTQPNGDEQLDQLFGVHVNTATTKNLAAKANLQIERGNLQEAIDTLDRLINLEPQNTEAISAREQLREQIDAQ